jgi:hypothetical protein
MIKIVEWINHFVVACDQSMYIRLSVAGISSTMRATGAFAPKAFTSCASDDNQQWGMADLKAPVSPAEL